MTEEFENKQNPSLEKYRTEERISGFRIIVNSYQEIIEIQRALNINARHWEYLRGSNHPVNRDKLWPVYLNITFLATMKPKKHTGSYYYFGWDRIRELKPNSTKTQPIFTFDELTNPIHKVIIELKKEISGN